MFACLLIVCLLDSLCNSPIAGCEEFKIFNYIIFLNYVTRPDDCLTYDVEPVFNSPDTDLLII